MVANIQISISQKQSRDQTLTKLLVGLQKIFNEIWLKLGEKENINDNTEIDLKKYLSL